MNAVASRSAFISTLITVPLPKHLNQSVIENALDPAKDVDCMTDGSMSGVFTGKPIGFPPCTPQACMEILDHINGLTALLHDLHRNRAGILQDDFHYAGLLCLLRFRATAERLHS